MFQRLTLAQTEQEKAKQEGFYEDDVVYVEGTVRYGNEGIYYRVFKTDAQKSSGTTYGYFRVHNLRDIQPRFENGDFVRVNRNEESDHPVSYGYVHDVHIDFDGVSYPIDSVDGTSSLELEEDLMFADGQKKEWTYQELWIALNDLPDDQYDAFMHRALNRLAEEYRRVSYE